MTTKHCLHTFCKSCIYRYIWDEERKTTKGVSRNLSKYPVLCPMCDATLGSVPRQSLMADEVFTHLVDKIFPDLRRVEEEQEVRRLEFAFRLSAHA
jgi:hypothetical protein